MVILYSNAIMFAKKLTASTAKAVFGLKDSDNVGKYFFTSMQAVPAFLLSAIKGRNVRCLIPYGIDQDDHFKIAFSSVIFTWISKATSLPLIEWLFFSSTKTVLPLAEFNKSKGLPSL